MKLFLRLRIIAGLLAFSISTFANSSIAATSYILDPYAMTGGDGMWWPDGDKVEQVLKDYKLTYTRGQIQTGLYGWQSTFRVTGYPYCNYWRPIILLISGKGHDLVFKNKAEAENFREQLPSIIANNSLNLPKYTALTAEAFGRNESIWAVGYKTNDPESRNPQVKLLYLPDPWGYSDENYECDYRDYKADMLIFPFPGDNK